jgi:hypothetical protein
MPGCSQYRTDKKSVEKLYETWEQFFIFLEKKQITSVSLTEAAKVDYL